MCHKPSKLLSAKDAKCLSDLQICEGIIDAESENDFDSQAVEILYAARMDTHFYCKPATVLTVSK